MGRLILVEMSKASQKCLLGKSAAFFFPSFICLCRSKHFETLLRETVASVYIKYGLNMRSFWAVVLKLFSQDNSKTELRKNNRKVQLKVEITWCGCV